MELEWSDIAVTILWLLGLGIAGLLAYSILFWDSLTSRNHLYSQGGESWLSRLSMAGTYLLVIGVPAVMLVGFVPVLSEAKRLGLSPQDIDLARQYADNRQELRALEMYLRQMDDALDEPSDPIWQKVKAHVVPLLGDGPRFNRDLWETLIDWGRQIEQERGTAQGTVSETRSVRAALARLAGADDLSARIATFRQRCGETTAKPTPRDGSVLDTYVRYAMTLHVFYPNDDIAYLAFADGFRRPTESNTMGIMVSLVLTAWILLVAVFIQRGMRLLSVRLLGTMLGLRAVALFRQFEHETFNPYRFLLIFVLVYPITALLAWVFIEPYYVLTYRQPWLYFTAVAWNVLMGGVLVETLGNALSVVLIWWGRDPLRMILDNLLVAAVSVPLLLYFQNSWFSIAAGMALGLLQSLGEKVMVWHASRKRPQPTLAELDRDSL
jgi:hypothetical protein